MKLESLRAERGEEAAQACELAVGSGEQPRQLRDLLHADARALTRLRAQERAQSPLDPQPLSLEREGVGVTVRQRVLNDGTRRLLRTRGRIEKGPNLGQDSGEAAVHSPLSIRREPAGDMGRRAYLRGVCGPCLAAVTILLLLASRRREGADPPSSAASTVRSNVPNVDPARTAALAVDLRTGAVVYSRNAALALVPASNQKLPVAYAALAQLGPGYRFHTEIVGSGTLVGDVWHGDLWLRGYGDPTLGPDDLAVLATDVASWGIRRVDGAVIADESWFDAVRVGPGWKPGFYIYESPPLSALVVDRGRYRGHTSANPALAAASLLRQALESAGVAVAERTRTGVLTMIGLPLAQDVSEPLADIVRFMGRESDNYTAEMLVKQLGAVYAGTGSTAWGVGSSGGALAAPASRSPASGSPTGRAFRVSTG